MHILITNDDGVFAPGLLALVKEMKKIGRVSIVAPDRNWSASGHVKTMERPLRVKEIHLADGTPALACDGAPSDCVALALLGLIEEKIDLVVSGMNPNPNIGHDVTYSGTVTAAMEASIAGLPGLAFSIDRPDELSGEIDYDSCARIARKLVDIIVKHNSVANLLLNINIPWIPEDQIKGIRITRLGLRVYRDELVKRLDPRDRPYYWIGGEFPTSLSKEGTDADALKAGFVSITPLSLDFTDDKALASLSRWTWSF